MDPVRGSGPRLQSCLDPSLLCSLGWLLWSSRELTQILKPFHVQYDAGYLETFQHVSGTRHAQMTTSTCGSHMHTQTPVPSHTQLTCTHTRALITQLKYCTHNSRCAHRQTCIHTQSSHGTHAHRCTHSAHTVHTHTCTHIYTAHTCHPYMCSHTQLTRMYACALKHNSNTAHIILSAHTDKCAYIHTHGAHTAHTHTQLSQGTHTHAHVHTQLTQACTHPELFQAMSSILHPSPE